MASLSIQFHATLDELVNLVETWMTDHSIHATAVEYRPYAATPMTKTDVRTTMMRQQVRRLMFTEKPPDCGVSGNIELLDKNIGALLLEIGRLGPRGLDECRLSTMQATATWKKIAGHLKRQTKSGVVGINENTGASGYYRNHRYTIGAKALSSNGIVMRPFAQSPVVLRFGE